MDADGTDEIGAEVAVKAEMVDPFAHDLGRQLGARHGIRSGIGNFTFAKPTAVGANRNFEGFRGGSSLGSGDAYTVWADLLNLDVGDIQCRIGRQIMGGVVEFVEDLFLDGSRVDHAAGALGFGYDDGAIFLYFGDRESDIRKTGDIFASRVGVISAGYLGAALKQMAGQHTDGHFVAIICRPTEMLHERAKGECRVGDPSGHDDVRVKSEGVRDRLRAEIDVRGQDLRVRQVQRCFIPPLLGAQAANVFPQIVAVDYGNAEALNAEFLGEFVQPARRAQLALERGAWARAERGGPRLAQPVPLARLLRLRVRLRLRFGSGFGLGG